MCRNVFFASVRAQLPSLLRVSGGDPPPLVCVFGLSETGIKSNPPWLGPTPDLWLGEGLGQCHQLGPSATCDTHLDNIIQLQTTCAGHNDSCWKMAVLVSLGSDLFRSVALELIRNPLDLTGNNRITQFSQILVMSIHVLVLQMSVVF